MQRAAREWLRPDGRVVLSVVPRGRVGAGARRFTIGRGVLMAVDRSKLPALGPEPAIPVSRNPPPHAWQRPARLDRRAPRRAARQLPGPACRSGRRRIRASGPAWRRSPATCSTKAAAISTPSSCTRRSGGSAAHLDTEIGSDATVLDADHARAVRRSRRRAARRHGHPPASRAARLRSRPGAAAQPARAAARPAAGARGSDLHAAALSEPSVRTSSDRHRRIAPRDDAAGGRVVSPFDVRPIGRSPSSRPGTRPTRRSRISSSARSPAGRRPARRERPADPPALRRPPPPQEQVALVHRPAAAQSELRIGHVAVARDTPDYHALLVAQHDARRAVRQPHQHEPARGQGLHLRGAHGVRLPPRGRSVRVPRQRPVRGDGGRDPRGPVGASRHPRRAPGDAAGARDRPRRRSRAAIRGTSRPPSRSAAAPRSSRSTICPTTTSRRSCRACWRSTKRTSRGSPPSTSTRPGS